MPSARTGTSTNRSTLRRRLAWPILIIAVAIPVAFISGRLERERVSAAVEFGEAVAMWDARTEVPDWLSDAAGHPVLLMDLARRLSERPETEEVIINASVEENVAGEARWRVRLSWPEAPGIDLVLAFRNLETKPHLVSVSGTPASTTGVIP